jgi:hypothetical protein
MLLIIFLSLVAKLALGSSECDFGTPKMEDFDCNKVGIMCDIYSIRSSY